MDTSGQDIQTPPISAATTERKRGSSPYLFGVLASGIVIGFLLGFASFNSPWGSSRDAPLYDEDLVTSTFEKASPAIVEIVVVPSGRARLFPRFGPEFTGSGFLVDGDGHIVTNEHVVDIEGQIKVTLQDGRELPAVKLGTSPADDLAVLRVDPAAVSDITPLPLADSSKVVPGQLAIAIGSPFREVNSISVGVVSGVNRSRASNELLRPIPGLVQTDAALNPGNSGGPLLNAKGEVIGVTSSVEIRSSVQIGVGYAIPSNTVSKILPALKEKGEFKRPWLGISGVPVTKEVSEALSLTTETGIYVSRVISGSPAAAASLRGASSLRSSAKGDVIVAVDGETVDSITDMVSLFNEHNPGDRVWLTIERNNKSFDVNVTLAPFPDT